VTVFDLQDGAPLPLGRRVQLADGREGVLIWEYEARGGQGANRVEAVGIRVSILYHAEKRRRYVTSVFPLDMSAESLERREESILAAANDDSRNCPANFAGESVAADGIQMGEPSPAPA
jgi:hypothetical protein